VKPVLVAARAIMAHRGDADFFLKSMASIRRQR
jgi:hypothetical protein